MKIRVFNTGGTIGMVGSPLRPAKSGAEVMSTLPPDTDIQFTFIDELEPIDSANMAQFYRHRLATLIHQGYEEADGILILHGSDTLAETCAYFSLIWPRQSKPMVVVSAQTPAGEHGSDAPLQLRHAVSALKMLHAAGRGGIFTVSGGYVYRGARLRKKDALKAHAFHTPGHVPVGYLEDETGSENTLLPPLRPYISSPNLPAPPPLESRVATFNITADTPPWILSDAARSGRLKGVILVCKGIGNIPSVRWKDNDGAEHASWTEAIAGATRCGVIVAILSPFDNTDVDLDAYEPGHAAAHAGALSLGNLTPEAADIKLRLALPRYAGDPATIQQYLLENINGELL